MQLVVDIGNTRTKAAVFEGQNMRESIVFEGIQLPLLEDLLNKYPGIKSGIVSSVVADSSVTEGFLEKKINLLRFSRSTALPIKNSYESPDTLGKDRLAAAVGAWSVFKGQDVLIIDAGTAIKVDLITAQNGFIGGSISPGLEMRFKALNIFTGKLPLISPDENYNSLTGKNTRESLLNGVQNGTLFEVQGFIDAYSRQYPGIKVVLTGGDASFFEPALKNRIFAHPGLVLSGLNEILLFNAK